MWCYQCQCQNQWEWKMAACWLFFQLPEFQRKRKNCNSRSGFPGEIAKVIVAQRQIHTYLQCMSNEHTYKKHNHTYTHGDVAVERRTSQCGSCAQTQTGKAGLAVCLSSTDNFGWLENVSASIHPVEYINCILFLNVLKIVASPPPHNQQQMCWFSVEWQL